MGRHARVTEIRVWNTNFACKENTSRILPLTIVAVPAG